MGACICLCMHTPNHLGDVDGLSVCCSTNLNHVLLLSCGKQNESPEDICKIQFFQVTQSLPQIFVIWEQPMIPEMDTARI